MDGYEIIGRILKAAHAVDRENLDSTEVHVCDQNDDTVRRKSLYGARRELSDALADAAQSDLLTVFDTKAMSDLVEIHERGMKVEDDGRSLYRRRKR